jgi:hypothetical protein
LGRALAKAFGWPHFDADDFFWMPTTPPFSVKRNPELRARLLLEALAPCESAVVSGSVMGWGRDLEDSFSLIAFLTVPADVRVRRLREREMAQLGRIDEAFLEWAAQYDEGRLEGRSRSKHMQWLSNRPCPIVHVDGEVALETACTRVREALAQVKGIAATNAA